APRPGGRATVHEAAATEGFERDCLIRLGAVLAPIGTSRPGRPCIAVELRGAGLPPVSRNVAFGDLVLLPLPAEGTVTLNATPERGFDLGAVKGRPLQAEVRGGVVGLIVAARGGQPLVLPAGGDAGIARLR